MDIFDRARSFDLAHGARQAGLYPYFTAFDGPDATTARLTTGEDVVMCGSNNYLGLTADHRIRAAAKAAIDRYGTSRTGSRLLNGNTPLHDELERELADFLGMPAALVFATGYQANLGVITGLLARDDVVLIDREAHASIYDACSMTPAKVRRFPHNDMDALRRRLAACTAEASTLVVVDGVYSMAGDLCPLPQLVELCGEYGARLLVDDAHGLGVLAEGRGTPAHFGRTADVDLLSITFSKALASVGGAVLGSPEVIEYLRHHARSQIFSAAAPPANIAAALAALDVLRNEPWLCEQALANAQFVQGELHDLGYHTVPSETPIICVPTLDVTATVLAWRALLDEGVYVNAILPPAASPRLRLSFTATHSPEQLKKAVSAFAAVRKLLPVGAADDLAAAS
ncbi:aminotransferase class I/II-fold pyridoxal phosphate-dependent enzyme [Jidongwangia harbinensis]|uniref:aminotransferase class I/II-fold pyridoxal phosphate-dependent enzyme n=1 Tax=Jidongwangia harbinensis TaxID=2878561 RepID=UPI001CDA2F30|nr:pyridoxal phosphate-dependent aminotransferase family protein [Jidongwangia harbinensis]MCA2211385.1 pyridoxal phosphate-dependent aminotransferase family protein [Jidongwangia harbinensis]